MKKIYIVLLAAVMLLGGCAKKSGNNEEVADLSSLRIVSPTGAPAVAFYNHSDDVNFETNSAPKNIVAMMADNDGPEIVVIDTVSGIAAVRKGADYALAATLTFGNFYIAATGNDDDGVMSKDDRIVLFGEGQTPDLVFHYIYGNELDDAIAFVPAVSDAAAILQNEGKDAEGNSYDYVFIAQPVLFASLKKNENASVYADIQKLYSEKSGSSLTQASVFVRNDVSDENTAAFLEGLKSDIEAALNDSAVIGEGFNRISEEEAQAKYGVAAAPVMAVIKQGNGLGLGFEYAEDIREDIDTFMTVMGRDVTNEEIYR